ncbi:[histone H3]-lysine(4) N-trimethyltransferase [Ranunculus cassubicifolius]
MENTHAVSDDQQVCKLEDFQVIEEINQSSEVQTRLGESCTDLGCEREERESEHTKCASQEDGLNYENGNVEPALVSNNVHNEVDEMEIELPSMNGGTRESHIEEEWLEQDEAVALWVKWRGKWQAGIRCVRADCPLPTLKARPTRDRKKYFVVFFPHTRNYSWADMQLVRPIQECPEPIAHRTHSQGLDKVQDLTIPRRYIMQRLAVGMLNVSDKLHNEAVNEAARQISTWKEFAMEASKCGSYSDLGRMLLKLHDMILQRYVDPNWIQNSFKSWEQRCQNAPSAEAVETLKEELVNSVQWNDIEALWDAPVQPELGPEWKTWKQDVMKWFSISHPMATGRDTDQCEGDDTATLGLQISRKRPKLEVRRAEMHVSQVEVGSLQETQQQFDSAEIDSGFFDRPGIENANTFMHESCKYGTTAEGTATSDYPSNVVDRWDGILVETENNKFNQTTAVEDTSVNGESGGEKMEPGNKFNQCVAFIEAKGRRCVRWANDGDDYCCVHLAIRDKSPKAEIGTPGDAPMCEGTTTHGTKCKHRSQHGSTFCKKHKLRHNQGVMDVEKPSIFSANLLKRSHSEMNGSAETVSCQVVAMTGNSQTSVYDFSDPVIEGGTLDEKVLVVENSELSIKDQEVESLHCIGSSNQNDINPCLDHAKLHTLYCEKHLPAFLKRARNGKSRIISKEIFTEFLRNCSSQKQKLDLHRACVLLYSFVKSANSRRNPVSKESPFQWILSEAIKDLSVGECLMKLLSCEREKLKRLWGFDIDNYKPDSPSARVPLLELESVQRSSNSEMNVKCKICSKEFSDSKLLGPHWMDDHKKEARWLFRGYACAICMNPFTNKNVLETHGKEMHQVQVLEQCLLLKCLPCGSHFVNAKLLWSHVLSEHSKDFEMCTVTPPLNMSVTEASHQPSERRSTKNCITDGSSRRFVCKFCGLKFDILPDLGRHHQAVHMGLNSVNHIPPQRRTHLNPYKSKSGRLSRPSFSKGLGVAASYRIRNRGNVRMKKHFPASGSVSTGEERMQIQVAEVAGLGRLVESQCSAVAKSLFSEIQKAKPRPSNLDILSVARTTCCKINLHASLEEQYGVLPERLYLKAAKLCSELNLKVEWHVEGYICPNGCNTSLKKSHNSFPLTPLPHSFVATKSVENNLVEVEEFETDECHYIIESHHIESQVSKKAIVLCQDLSFGTESVSVSCVVDDDLVSSLRTVIDDGSNNTTVLPMPWDTFTYVKERLVDASLNCDTESSQLGCACPQSTCSPDACDHVYLFDNDYEDAKDIYGQPMQGRFPYDKEGRIILEEGYVVYECNSSCSCDKTCPNRVLQNGVQVKLEVFKTKNKGWAVRAREAISRGTFVCEYIGRVVSREEATKEDVRYTNESCSYLYKIDDMSEGVISHVIDATKNGNVSRFINHSCSPNLACYQVLVESMDSQLAHIGLYASRDIEAGEEVAYDYHDKMLHSKEQPCYCSLPNCRGNFP